MKEIYVIKSMFKGWQAIAKEEAEAKVNDGLACGVEMELKGVDGEITKITLLKERFSLYGGMNEDEANTLVLDYVEYVESITGLEMPAIGQ